MCRFALHTPPLIIPHHSAISPSLSIALFNHSHLSPSLPPSFPPFLPASCRSGPPGSYSFPSDKRMDSRSKKEN